MTKQKKNKDHKSILLEISTQFYYSHGVTPNPQATVGTAPLLLHLKNTIFNSILTTLRSFSVRLTAATDDLLKVIYHIMNPVNYPCTHFIVFLGLSYYLNTPELLTEKTKILAFASIKSKFFGF